MDANLVVPRSEVDLGEYLGTMEEISEIIDQGDRESVFDSDVVEGTIVDAHSKFPIFLLDE